MPYYGQNYMYGYQTPQNGYQTSFVHVQSENEARAYPVAPNNSVTFIDENRPYLYTKTADASQLGGSRFEKYRLEKEATEGSSGFQEKQYNVSDFATKQQIEALEKKHEEEMRRKEEEAKEKMEIRQKAEVARQKAAEIRRNEDELKERKRRFYKKKQKKALDEAIKTDWLIRQMKKKIEQ